MPTRRTLMTHFRLSTELVKRIDAHASRLRERFPGLLISRSDALRMLVERALQDEEEDRDPALTHEKRASPGNRSRAKRPRPTSA